MHEAVGTRLQTEFEMGARGRRIVNTVPAAIDDSTEIVIGHGG